MSDVIRAEGRDTTYETALELHEAIMHSAQAAAILRMLRRSFASGSRRSPGIRARQAYTYIAVYERFGEARHG